MAHVPAEAGEVDAAETRLGVRFPKDYRAFLLTANGSAGWFGQMYVELFSVDQVVELTEVHHHEATHPGLVFIGSDGAGEGIGFDFRKAPPPIVLVNLVSEGWHEAILQASSFTEFVAQRARGEDFRWSGEYA